MMAAMVPTLRRVAVLLALLAGAAASAGTLRVTVTNADGRPATDTVVLLQVPGAPPATPAPEPVPIVQKDIRFVPFVTAVALGSTVRFVNRDSFDHHVRSQPGGPLASVPPAKQFEFRLARMRGGTPTSADLELDVPGTIVLGCHIHGSMRGHIYIATSPWFAVTDERGQVVLEGVPDGAAELRTWHPDELVEQPAQKLQVAGDTKAESRLNFTPRRRLQPRRSEYDY